MPRVCPSDPRVGCTRSHTAQAMQVQGGQGLGPGPPSSDRGAAASERCGLCAHPGEGVLLYIRLVHQTLWCPECRAGDGAGHEPLRG